MAEAYLSHCEFDVFVGREHETHTLKQVCKTNVIRELGDDHPFTYDFPILICHTIVVRKSQVSMALMQEWLAACEVEAWIDGKAYGDMHEAFRWSTPEQSLLCVIIANWIRS